MRLHNGAAMLMVSRARPAWVVQRTSRRSSTPRSWRSTGWWSPPASSSTWTCASGCSPHQSTTEHSLQLPAFTLRELQPAIDQLNFRRAQRIISPCAENQHISALSMLKMYA